MMIQGSQDWFQARVGKATASRFKDVLATLRNGKPGSGRKNYCAELAIQRLTGVVQESYTNTAMEWGTQTEPEARLAFEEATEMFVEEVGFIDHPELMAGCSPDGLIDDDGGVEIKSPYQSAVHIETLRNGLPSEHIAQIQGSMWITGREYWWFVSYDPRMPDGLRLYKQRVERDDRYILNLEGSVKDFLGEVDSLVEELNRLRESA